MQKDPLNSTIKNGKQDNTLTNMLDDVCARLQWSFIKWRIILDNILPECFAKNIKNDMLYCVRIFHLRLTSNFEPVFFKSRFQLLMHESLRADVNNTPFCIIHKDVIEDACALLMTRSIFALEWSHNKMVPSLSPVIKHTLAVNTAHVMFRGLWRS